MTKRTRETAMDFMWQEAGPICGLHGQVTETEHQEALASLLSEIGCNKAVPLDVVERLGDVARLAWRIGRASTKPEEATP